MFPGSGFDLVIGPSKMSDDSPLPNVSPGRGHMPYGQCTSIRRSRAISIRLSLDRIHNCRCCTTGTSRLSPGQALRQRLWVNDVSYNANRHVQTGHQVQTGNPYAKLITGLMTGVKGGLS